MSPAAATVIERVRAWVARQGAPRAGERLVVACSGGGDSTALVMALHALKLGPLHVVYVDHGLRAGTDEEARHVARLAAAHEAGFERARVTVALRGNLLANARTVRYQALAAVAVRVGARAIAVGHTATDQAETVVFRAARGDLQHALSGMAPCRFLDGELALLRPLLEVTRAEAAAFVAERGWTAISDPTNERDDLTRTQIRRGLAPVDGATAHLCRLADHTAAWLRQLDAQAIALGPLDDLPARAVADAGFDVALRLLRRAGLHRAGHAHARALLRLSATVEGSRSIDLGDGLVAERSYQRVRLGPAGSGDPGDVALAVGGPGSYRWLDGEVQIRDGSEPGDAMDATQLAGPLELRNLRPGDRFRTSGGHRKLADILIDRKVPRAARRRLPILTVAGTPVWVATVGVAHHVRAGARELSLHVDSPLTYAIMRVDSRREVARLADEPNC